MKPRWDPCIIQDDRDFVKFLGGYVKAESEGCLLIGGAGFDRRATVSPSIFAELESGCASLKAMFFREERVIENSELREAADRNEAAILQLLSQATFPVVQIFSEGSSYSESATVVGGRRAIELVQNLQINDLTDIFIDISSLSCGVFFSLVAYFVELYDNSEVKFNLHIIVVEEPDYDRSIKGIPASSASMLHGYRGAFSLDSNTNASLLWIPTLSPRNQSELSKIFHSIRRSERPIDVCPIIPFPCMNPRLPDLLVEEYQEQLDAWGVDDRDLLYAAESDPLDSYRAILALFNARNELFSQFGGSHVVLSPLGNKMLAVGAMLAALEQKIHVAMVESVGYEGVSLSNSELGITGLKHVWLCGDPYP